MHVIIIKSEKKLQNSVAIFGSSLRNEFEPESDLDILVEFEPGRKQGFFKLFEMEGNYPVYLVVGK